MLTDPVSGKQGVDVAELCRVFPRIKLDNEVVKSVKQTGLSLTPEPDSELIRALQAHIATLERLLDEKDSRIALLEDMRERSSATPATNMVTAPIRQRSLFDRLVAGIEIALKP